MRKFSQVNEGKVFLADPSVIKKYAGFIVPLYVNGFIKCDERLVEEWVEANRKANRAKSSNTIFDIELMAVRLVIDNPLSQTGFEKLQLEIAAKCPKLEKLLRQHYSSPENFK